MSRKKQKMHAAPQPYSDPCAVPIGVLWERV
jgi:hypothetical protein